MKTFTIDGYDVWDTDGYTHSHIAYVSSVSLAVEMVGKNAYMGFSPYKRSFIVFDTMKEVIDNDAANLRASALAKLTLAELTALGITK